ncbi:MAG: RDD family protein [Phycisphaerae bacterium]
MPGTDQPEDSAFAACEVTGEVLPRSALVRFQGKLVSERGKQILLDQIRSGESQAPTQTLMPGPWRRFGCVLLDNFLLYVVSFVVTFAIGFGIGEQLRETHASTLEIQQAIYELQLWGAIIGFTLNVAYYGLMHYFFGSTIGKFAGKEKVIRTDGGKITFLQSIVRELVMWFGCVFYIVLIASKGAPGILLGEFSVIAWLLFDWMFIILDRHDRRALHDRIAGTRVIFSDGRGGSIERDSLPAAG